MSEEISFYIPKHANFWTELPGSCLSLYPLLLYVIHIAIV